jgi:transcriptional regulator with XRE-family HTH domain
VVPSAVSAYETGRKFPPAESLARIVDLGGISFDWLLARGTTPGAKERIPLERHAVQMSGYLETAARILPAKRREKLIEDIELINFGLQCRAGIERDIETED